VTLTFDLLTLNFYSTSGSWVKLKAFLTNVGWPKKCREVPKNKILNKIYTHMRSANIGTFRKSHVIQRELKHTTTAGCMLHLFPGESG